MEDKKIQLIFGKKKIERFKTIFNWINKTERGKLTSSYCLVRTNLILEPTNEEHEMFNELQEEAHKNGFLHNCFCLNV